MEFFRQMRIDFIERRWLAFSLSGLFLLTGAISLAFRGGPNWSIDFVGGTLVQIKFPREIYLGDVRKALVGSGLESSELQQFAKGNEIIIRVKRVELLPGEVAKKVVKVLEEAFPTNKLMVERTEVVGPKIGKHLVKQAFLALTFSFLGIVTYVGWRFEFKYGIAGVLALVHDVFSTVGLFSILNKEISITVVAALLTLAGYSINDTIVVYDRIRENVRFHRKESLAELMNRSINETLSRTIITSLTVILVLIALFFFGGEVIHDFSFALLFGVIVGTYSSIFIASSIVYEWQMWEERRKGLRLVRVK